MDRKFHTDRGIKGFFMIQINVSKKNRLDKEALSKKSIRLNLSHKIPPKGNKEEIDFYNNSRKRERYFIQKSNLSRSS
jgi:hypothetical protein